MRTARGVLIVIDFVLLSAADFGFCWRTVCQLLLPVSIYASEAGSMNKNGSELGGYLPATAVTGGCGGGTVLLMGLVDFR